MADHPQAVREVVGIPVLANGNILSRADAEACMAYTGTQGVLSAGATSPCHICFAVPEDSADCTCQLRPGLALEAIRQAKTCFGVGPEL